jgi:hypothetical protein
MVRETLEAESSPEGVYLLVESAPEFSAIQNGAEKKTCC